MGMYLTWGVTVTREVVWMGVEGDTMYQERGDSGVMGFS
jgi:hypothetical protein